MKPKNKRNVICIVMLIGVLVLIFVLYNTYSSRMISYASSEKILMENVIISDAKKVDIEEIIKNNQKNNKEEILTEEMEVEYITEYRNNAELAKGTIRVVQEGRTGIQQVTLRITYDENMMIVSEEEINSIITKSAINKIIEIGTSDIGYVSKISKGDKVYVTSDRLDVMRDNSGQSDKITTISKNKELEVKEIDNNWCKVYIEGQVGWIKIENIANVEEKFEKETNGKIERCDFNMALNKPSGLTLEQFKKVLKDPKDVNNVFSENAEYFYYIEKQYGVNGVFVAAVGIHESAWGTSKIALDKKNLFGYGAYDSGPYKNSYSFSSYSEGIDLMARVMVKYYLNSNGTAIYGNEIATGKYYNGNTISAVNKKYATDKNWANKVYKYMEYLYKKI